MSDSPGKRLAWFRKSLGMNQRDFAAQLGVGPSRIGSIETDVDPPSRRFLQTISERYNISADWLLNGHGDQFHAPIPGFQGRHKRVEPPDHARPDHGDVRFADNSYTEHYLPTIGVDFVLFLLSYEIIKLLPERIYAKF